MTGAWWAPRAPCTPKRLSRASRIGHLCHRGAMEPTDFRPLRGNARVARFPLVLAGILAVVFAATAWSPPAGHREWLLEVGPALIGIAVLAAVFPRFPMSRLVYAGVFIHSLVLTYGGYYTYALTPLGNWAKDAFHL